MMMMLDVDDPEATHALTMLHPEQITLRRLPQARVVALQMAASKAVWRPAPGRKNGYGVYHSNDLIGLMFLASPVINMGARDTYLKLPQEDKGYALRRVADMSVCVGIQPLAWHWNVGKLVALLATSTQIAADWEERYGDPLEHITTTSLYGRGAQYNRVYKFLGYTKGYGHQHITDDEYHEMLAWMRDNGVAIPSSKFGAGSNPRMRRIAAYQRASGTKVNLHHGNKRGIYTSPANAGTVGDLAAFWFERWGFPRYERTREVTPPYVDGLT